MRAQREAWPWALLPLTTAGGIVYGVCAGWWL